MDIYAQMVSRIIKEQQTIIGPIAIDQAKKVTGIQLTSPDDVQITGNEKDVMSHLVEQYARLFGKASVAICKEAIEPLVSQNPATELPEILKN